MAKSDSLPRIADEDSPTNTLFASSNRCFHLPCFAPRRPPPTHSKSSLWERLTLSDAQSSPRWWSKPFRAIRKLREWSEIVAGPKWKTFIRRFNRNRSSAASGAKHGEFQYDPLSYALNFDEGPAQVYQTDDDYGYYPDFASRYVSGSSKTSLDLGGDGGNFTSRGS